MTTLAGPQGVATLATGAFLLHHGAADVKTEDSQQDLLSCPVPALYALLPVRIAAEEGLHGLSHSESISSCSEAVAAGSDPCSSMSHGKSLSVGSHVEMMQLMGVMPDQEGAAAQPAAASKEGQAGGKQQLKHAASFAAPAPASAGPAPSPTSSSQGVLMPWTSTPVQHPLAGSSLMTGAPAHVPFPMLGADPCSNLLALQSVAASLNQAAAVNSAAAADPQLAQLLKRKGKGGRQPATDPRLDPSIDPKKAKRILANRQSAAKSKMKQKLFVEGLKQQHAFVALQRQSVSQEVGKLSSLCTGLEAENEMLESNIQAFITNLNAQAAKAQLLPAAPFPLPVHPEPATDALANAAGSALPWPTANAQALDHQQLWLASMWHLQQQQQQQQAAGMQQAAGGLNAMPGCA